MSNTTLKPRTVPAWTIWLILTLLPLVVAWYGLLHFRNPPNHVPVTEGVKLENFIGPWYRIAYLKSGTDWDIAGIPMVYGTPHGEDKLKLSDNEIFVLLPPDTTDSKEEAKRKVLKWVGQPSTGSFTFACWGPMRCGLHVIALDTEKYQWMMVTGYSHDYLEILSRTPVMKESRFKELKSKAEAWGYDTSKLLMGLGTFVAPEMKPSSSPVKPIQDSQPNVVPPPASTPMPAGEAGLPPSVYTMQPPKVENMQPPKVENMQPPKVENMHPPPVEIMLPPQIMPGQFDRKVEEPGP